MFRLLSPLLVLATLGACAPADAPAPATRADLPACAPGERDALPLLGSQGMNLEGSVNGQKVMMSLSTGLGLTALLPATAQRLGLPADPMRQSSFASGSGPITRQNVTVRSLRVGTRDWGSLSLAVRQMFPPAGETMDFDGLLAANLLRGLEVGIDMPARRATLFNPQGCRPGTPPWPVAASLPVEMMEHGTPRISVRVEGQVVSARIASGQDRSSMARSLAERLGLARTNTTVRAYGTNPDAIRGRVYRVRELAAGEEVLRNLEVTGYDGESEGGAELTLGRDWLSHRAIWLSYPQRRVYLAAPAG